MYVSYTATKRLYYKTSRNKQVNDVKYAVLECRYEFQHPDFKLATMDLLSDTKYMGNQRKYVL